MAAVEEAARALPSEVADAQRARSVDDAVVDEARERVAGARREREAARVEARARFDGQAVIGAYIR